jgi:cleavage and polyadenylation specificity factor subunit 1
MLDEDTGAEPRAVSASIADPFLLIIRDDSSAFIAQIDNSNELEELRKDDETLAATKWLTGCLYADTYAVFAEEVTEKGANPAQSILMFLLSAHGALYVRTIRYPCHSLTWCLTSLDLPSPRLI